MKIICENCKEPFEGFYNQRWCHKPPCELARAEADRLSQTRNRRAPPPVCRHCKKVFAREGCSSSVWCKEPVCQIARTEHYKSLRKKYDKNRKNRNEYIPTGNFIAPGEKVSNCIECNQPTPNRFGRCNTCMKAYLDKAEYDTLYSDPNMFSACYS